MFKKTISLGLIILHLFTFGPLKEAFAFTAESISYRLTTAAPTQGGSNRLATSVKINQDAIGEPCAGRSTSANYILTGGFVPAIQSNPPILLQNIPYQKWAINASRENAFDLDNYFSSPDGYPLSYIVSGNSKVNIAIDTLTHIVSFSQAEGWSGVEKVIFSATDTEGNTTQSNEVALQVEDPQGPDQPTIVEINLEPPVIKEGDKVSVVVKATDPDNEELNFSYNLFFTETRRYKEGDFWYSEAIWQTSPGDKGHPRITVTVTDPTSRTDSEEFLVNIGNLNHAPVLEPIADIIVNEGEVAVISPHATDEDNDAITYYFSQPFDAQGRWFTDYESAGTYSINVIASDGIDTVYRTAKVIVNNTNRKPVATLTLNKYTALKNEEILISLKATDPDNEPMTFVIKKDGQQIASGNIENNATYTTITTFADEGYHKISAIVTDPANLNSEPVTLDVNIASLDINVNPIMGDFNGDALTDLGVYNIEKGLWEVALSKRGVFEAATEWRNGFGSRDWWPIGGDFNGDGKTDIGIYNPSNGDTKGQLKVALSSGSSFNSPSLWLTFSDASSDWQPFTGNFNGDKYTDFAVYNKVSGEVRVFLCNGLSFDPAVTWATEVGNDYTAFSGDFNADSLGDLCLYKKSSAEVKIMFSNTASFVDPFTWNSGFPSDKDLLISDFNHDGLTDVGYWDKTSGNWYYAISTGTKFIYKGLWLEAFGSDNYESVSTGDFDGNGLVDAACFDRDLLGIERWQTRLSTNKPADLLTEIDNGIGARTQITYTFAAEYNNPDLPFPVYVASSVSSIDTLPANQPQETYTQTFSYQGGYFDTEEREFRGFQKVTVTDPITGNYTETYFYQGRPGQDGALKGQIEKVIAYEIINGQHYKVSETINTYEVKKSGPPERFLGFPALIQQATTIWEKNRSNITTTDINTYDNIGNVIESRNNISPVYRDDNRFQIIESRVGSTKINSTTYAPAYEAGFNCPLETALKDKNNNLISKKNFAYDTKGNLIKETAWLNNQETQPSVTYAYDDFGNLILTTNALGHSIKTEYETDFYTFPKKVANAVGHSVSYVYDPRFGVIKSITNANNKTSITKYDSFGRPIEVINTLGQTTTTYTYPDFNTKITTQGNLFKAEYIDGLGRKYKTILQGEDGTVARNVITEVYYNEHGLVDRESLPHYEEEDPNQIAYNRYVYDNRGRVIETIADFPGEGFDAASFIRYETPLYAETIDAKGHKKGVHKDVYGNILEVKEFVSDEPQAKPDGAFHTYYEYDLQNNLIKTTDNLGNTAQIFYDSLGRKIKTIDPDMGEWTYKYDLVGNLIEQTDAKGQILIFTYDPLNRLVEKKGLSSQMTIPEILATYYYDDTSKDNCLGRLSKVIDRSGSTEFFYDALGREIKSIKTMDDNQYTVVREYDVLDRLTKLIYPDGEVVNYIYDTNSGLLESINGVSPQMTIPYVQDITYNANGQIKTIKYGNGTQTNYTYSNDLRLSQILTTREGQGVILQNLNYIFDKNGNILTLTDNIKGNIRQYAYDDLDRLKEERKNGNLISSYQYDSIGNMIYKSDVGQMVYPAVGQAHPHAVIYAGGVTYQYDANGNMIVGKNKMFEYDIENRLTKVNELGAIATFVYDGDGGRVKKLSLREDIADKAIYIGSLYEVDSSGKTTKHIFAGSNRVASVITIPEGAKQSLYYHTDHLGSSSVITDANGNQVASYEYTPYGTVADIEGTDVVKHKFTSKELDSTTGLYFYGARYYDPQLGRFITADPTIQRPYDPQDLNRYTYCRNNPINYTDPTGLGWKKFWKRVFNWFKDEVLQPLISFTVTLIFTWGNIPAATAAAIATAALDTGEGRQFIKRTGRELFDDAFGMDSQWAQVASSITIHTAATLALEWGISNMIADQAQVSKYNPNDPKQLNIKQNPSGYYPFGRYPGAETDPTKARVGFRDNELWTLSKNGEPVALVGKVPKAGGLSRILPGKGVPHTGATFLSVNGGNTVKQLAPSWSYASLFGTCHQVTNTSLLKGGISNTVWGIFSDWEIKVTTIVYGNYGGGVPQKVYQGIKSYNDE